MEDGQARDDDDGPDEPGFVLTGVHEARLPIIVAVPHGGRAYPDAVAAAMRDPVSTRRRLEDRYVDAVARPLAAETGAALMVAHVPRAMIDLNRAPDDIDWGMIAGAREPRPRHSLANRRSRSGLGLIPRRLTGVGEIWKAPIAASELTRRIAAVHRPYHRDLARALETLRDQWGSALLIDLHSMPPLPARGEGEGGAHYVIGDRFGASCAHGLSAIAIANLSAKGRLVAHNRPYSGGYGLDTHGAPRRGLHAMQVEICRSLYLDAALDRPSARLGAVVRELAGLVRVLADEVAAIGRDRQLPQAAE